jgi:hypothetical protein
MKGEQMITLDELISELQAIRKTTKEDGPLRLCLREGEDGYQYTVLGTHWYDLGKEGKMTLIMGGDVVGSMPWDFAGMPVEK